MKKSRPITVGDIKFRYQISTSQLDENYNFKLNLTIEKVEPKGNMLIVQGITTRNFWLDFSDHLKINEDNYPVILPSHISSIVQYAISNGWKLNKQSKPMVIKTTNNSFLCKKI